MQSRLEIDLMLQCFAIINQFRLHLKSRFLARSVTRLADGHPIVHVILGSIGTFAYALVKIQKVG